MVLNPLGDTDRQERKFVCLVFIFHFFYLCPYGQSKNLTVVSFWSRTHTWAVRRASAPQEQVHHNNGLGVGQASCYTTTIGIVKQHHFASLLHVLLFMCATISQGLLESCVFFFMSIMFDEDDDVFELSGANEIQEELHGDCEYWEPVHHGLTREDFSEMFERVHPTAS